jgi:hypothetical protein
LVSVSIQPEIKFILKRLPQLVKPFPRAVCQDPGAMRGFELQLRPKLNINVTIRKQF